MQHTACTICNRIFEKLHDLSCDFTIFEMSVTNDFIELNRGNRVKISQQFRNDTIP